MVLSRAEQQLRGMGFSDDGIRKMLTGLGSFGNSVGTGVERYGDSVETGRHALNGLSAADAELFSKWGGRLGWAGNAAQLVSAGFDWFDGGDTRNEDLGKALGGVGGSWLGGAGAGATVGSFGGLFDPKLPVGAVDPTARLLDLQHRKPGAAVRLPTAGLAVGSDHHLRCRLLHGRHCLAVHIAPQGPRQDLRGEQLQPAARPAACTEIRQRVRTMACA